MQILTSALVDCRRWGGREEGSDSGQEDDSDEEEAEEDEDPSSPRDSPDPRDCVIS